MPEFFKKITIPKEVIAKEVERVPALKHGSKLALAWASLSQLISFILLLMVYLFVRVLGWVSKGRLAAVSLRILARGEKFFDHNHAGSISRLDLIELSLKNMASKRTRTVVTIGGMTLGIATIVFLVSIGYGLQQLVISRVARLGEMKQADVSPQPGAKIVIDDKALSSIHDIAGVQKTLPLISVVGKVSYQSSVSDMAVYGVTTDYLTESAIKPIEGKVFDSNNLVMDTSLLPGVVAGVSDTNVPASVGDEIQPISYAIDQSTWLKVRESPTITGKILGYTKRVEGTSQGTEVWGNSFVSEDGRGEAGQTESGKPLGKWVKTTALLWDQTACDPATQGDCEAGHYLVKRDTDNTQIQKEGYIAEIGMTTNGETVTNSGNVLGVSTTTASDSAAQDATINWVNIASVSAQPAEAQVQTVALSANAVKQAVVNRAMLKVLGLAETGAVGKSFDVSFVVVGDLLADPTKRIESTPTSYTIVGVTPDDKTPVIYVPFIDLRSLGITQYSQSKVVVASQNDLPKIRRQIEAMGFITRSVADTVAQINSLFGTMRLILALLGMVALAVAALGMFNTLTVSLLERTREVGLMKAMGMKSSEVSELFLTESMIMGFVGGLLGIVIGFAAGKLVGVILSVFSLIKGVGIVDISYLPFPFLLTIILLSLLVGVGTGMYPAKRATTISALNALRYE